MQNTRCKCGKKNSRRLSPSNLTQVTKQFLFMREAISYILSLDIDKYTMSIKIIKMKKTEILLINSTPLRMNTGIDSFDKEKKQIRNLHPKGKLIFQLHQYNNIHIWILPLLG